MIIISDLDEIEDKAEFLMQGLSVDHSNCGAINMLDVVAELKFLDGDKRERINTLIADALTKYDCGELVVAIENALQGM